MTYPCVIEGLKPPEGNEAGSMIGVGTCDKDIVPLYFNAGSFRGLAFGIDLGKTGTYLYDNKVDSFKYPTAALLPYSIKTENRSFGDFINLFNYFLHLFNVTFFSFDRPFVAEKDCEEFVIG